MIADSIVAENGKIRSSRCQSGFLRAERVGFEPTVGVNPHLLSREAQSAVLCHLSVPGKPDVEGECSELPTVAIPAGPSSRASLDGAVVFTTSSQPL